VSHKIVLPTTIVLSTYIITCSFSNYSRMIWSLTCTCVKVF